VVFIFFIIVESNFHEGYKNLPSFPLSVLKKNLSGKGQGIKVFIYFPSTSFQFLSFHKFKNIWLSKVVLKINYVQSFFQTHKIVVKQIFDEIDNMRTIYF
jgi:hypothetical protein